MPTEQRRPPGASFLERARMGAGAAVVDNMFRALSAFGKLHPKSRPEAHNVEVIRDVPYGDAGLAEHRLDVYRPTDMTGPRPVVLYVHGGGFRILSKDTHWVMGLAFARRGCVVFNIDYRLAPRHPYPAAIEDTCAAAVWVQQNAHRWGGDARHLLFAGESAGANLVTSLAIASSYRRPEPFARAVFDAGVRARAVLPACGIFQVSDTDRFTRRRRIPQFIADRLREVQWSYLGDDSAYPPGALDLADPVVFLERAERPERPLPPFFTAVGTRDPLLDDTRRLESALARLGTRCTALYYPGELHAFHALVWRPNAVAFWRECYRFVDECLADAAEAAVEETEKA